MKDPNVPSIQFRRTGRAYQLCIENAEALEQVLALDDAHWMATSAPVSAFRADARFTEFLDSDKNGRIRTDEVRDAIRWLQRVLGDMSGLVEGHDHLALAALRDDTEAGRAVARTARFILEAEGIESGKEIDLATTRKFLSSRMKQPQNGDGVVVPEAGDGEVRTYLEALMRTVGGSEDASGVMGVGEADVMRFQSAIDDWLHWCAAGEDSACHPFGDLTDEVIAAYLAVASAVKRFFALTAAGAFDPRAVERAEATAWSAEDVASVDAVSSALITRLIARPGGESPSLPLAASELNPAYLAPLAQLQRLAFEQEDGEPPEAVSEQQWLALEYRLAPALAHRAARKGDAVASLPRETLSAWQNGALAAEVRKLIAADSEVAEFLHGVELVEKLLLYHANILRFLNNFVSFSELYATDRKALFEAGGIVIDGRWFRFVMQVDDVKAHAKTAATSNLFIIYLEVLRGGGAAPMHIVTAATSGSRGNLGVGKRGLYVDTEGREHDARVVEVIENPISLREALVSPFVNVRDRLVGKIEQLSSSSEKELLKATDEWSAGKENKPDAPTPASNTGGLNATGALVGLSVSAAAVGSAAAFITKTFSGMTAGQRVAGLLGAALVVLLPASLVATLKLGKQDLSSLLEASGWAINARMRLNRPLRWLFTHRPAYPPHAVGVPDKWRIRILLILLGIVIVAYVLFLLLASTGEC